MKTTLIVFFFATVMAYLPGRWPPHHHHHHHGPSPPPYLKNLSREAVKEYFKIMHNKNSTIAQQKTEVMKWAKKNGIQEQVEKFDKKMDEHMKEVKKNVTELINYLPTAFKEFSAIMEDDTLTRQEQKQKRRELTAKNPKAFQVLKFLFAQFMPHGPHGPRGPHGPFGPHGGPGGRGGRGPFGGFGGPGGPFDGPGGRFGGRGGPFSGIGGPFVGRPNGRPDFGNGDNWNSRPGQHGFGNGDNWNNGATDRKDFRE